ncbi:hypothetical protein ASF55_18455 [Methylobacterium sp. Leaf119]|nr:hypothetical protein ASF55_18455 [Methylobacterium sp. Leaf119]
MIFELAVKNCLTKAFSYYQLKISDWISAIIDVVLSIILRFIDIRSSSVDYCASYAHEQT